MAIYSFRFQVKIDASALPFAAGSCSIRQPQNQKGYTQRVARSRAMAAAPTSLQQHVTLQKSADRTL
jgi:hypothetical protein